LADAEEGEEEEDEGQEEQDETIEEAEPDEGDILFVVRTH
jgi:hypothetical protein